MDAYQLAIEQARKELSEAQAKLKSLNLRVSQLEAVVAQLEALTTPKSPSPNPAQLGMVENAPSLAGLAKIVLPTTADTQPLWKAIINALNGKKSDFTVPDALHALERTGRYISSPNRLNIVRNTLIQNKAFRRISAGHYCVIGFENNANEEEARSTEQAS
jgi:hypothetical protein